MMRLFVLAMKVGWRILRDYFAWMIKFNRHKEKYPISLRFERVQSLVSYVIGKVGVIYDMPNFDAIYTDDKRKLIVCNHLSMFDPLLFIINAKRPLTFVSKIETKKFPFVGKLLNIIDGQFLDRSNLKEQIKSVINTTKLIKSQEYDVVIFPEGTRTKEPEKGMLDFHPGSFKIATKANCDVAVTSIYGSFRPLKFFKFKKKKELYVQFKVLDVLKFDDIKDLNSVEIMQKSRELMDQNMVEFINKDKEFIKSIS